MTTTPLELTWREPKWFYRPRLYNEFRRGMWHIVNPRSLVRIGVSTVVVSTVLVVGFKAWFPEMVVPNLWPLLLVLPGLLLLLSAKLGFLFLFAPRVTIYPKGIMIHQGEDVCGVESRELTAIYLTVHPAHRVRMRICYVRRNKRHSRVTAIPEGVDLTKLVQSLPVRPIVRDARRSDRTKD